MGKKSFYDENFFNNQFRGSYLSAKKIVPIIKKFVNPRSVVDVGCGVGTWLKVFEENGIKDIVGIDGQYISKEKLMIDPKYFIPKDLSRPFILNRKFDLALSLEVAEHLPKRSAEIFINSLTSLSDIVVFSAAIPKQGGVNHLNEQWPQYWKRLFQRHNYLMLDPLRFIILNDRDIQWWYKQNVFVFVKEEKLKKVNKINLLKVYNQEFFLIHKSIFKKHQGILNKYFINLLD
ncbi:MAG: methyltransferase domain-containing protein [Nanoarchaeota archaeon]|nr:methyltransferase domain-containing protein [Nanoarchaeota archaeon]